MHKKLKNIFYIFFPLVIGGIVSLIIKDHIDYTTLNQPPLSPPKWAFPVAWSIIYLLMGIAYYVFRQFLVFIIYNSVSMLYGVLFSSYLNGAL